MKFTMIKKVSITALTVLMLVGCGTVQNANKKQKGAVIGAAGGAILGGIIGNNIGDKNNSALGAIIGGVLGGVAGGYIGDRMDRQAERIENEIPGAEVTRVGEGISVVFDENSGVYFDTGKHAIKGKSMETLQKLAGIFMEYPDSNILVEGHTDSSGSESLNMALSKKRAEAVTGFLTSKGVSITRFTTNAYGEMQPKYDNATVEGRAKNRRVELAIVANEALKQEAIQNTKN